MLTDKVVDAMRGYFNIDDPDLDDRRAAARAAISVVLEAMREPNSDMIDAALHAIDGNPRGSTGYATRAARKCWDAMLHAFKRTALDADTGV